MSFNMEGVTPEFVQQMANGAQGGITPQMQSYDPQQVQQFLRQVPPQQFQQYAQQAMQQVPPPEYGEHITPGAGGTNPLGNLGGGMLGTIAGSLLNNLVGGGNAQEMTNQMGLRTANPQQMNEQDVAQMAQYAQQHNPGALAATASQHQDKPDVVQAVLGNKALTLALGGLAAAAMAGKLPGVTPRFGPAARQ